MLMRHVVCVVALQPHNRPEDPRYVAGYGAIGNAEGPTLSLVVVDATSSEDVKVEYTSPVLNK
jgi:hypothetical protein